MSLATKITAALKDNWLTGAEARDVIRTAQKNNVTHAERAQVIQLSADVAANGVKIAAGTQRLLDAFIARHDGAIDLETTQTSQLGPIFDAIDFFFAPHDAGISWVKSLPSAVISGMAQKLALDGMKLSDWDWSTTERFKLPVGGEWAYGVLQDDGGNGGGFSILVFSPKGRLLWELSGQND